MIYLLDVNALIALGHLDHAFHKRVIARLKQNPELAFQFVTDDQDVAGLPAWVKAGGQTTDGHLLQLASAHGAVLATLDAKIPGAFVIP